MIVRFTLVELMIVVAIAAILAGLAVPRFLEMQLRSKRAELPLVADGIATSQIARYAEHHSWVAPWEIDDWWPDANPGKAPRPGPSMSWMSELGFKPDGAVRGSYGTALHVPLSCIWGLDGTDGLHNVGDHVLVSAMSDLDDDGAHQCGAIGLVDGARDVSGYGTGYGTWWWIAGDSVF